MKKERHPLDDINIFDSNQPPPKGEEVNKEIFKEVKPKKEKENKISREIEEFLWLQAQVLGKLSRHPEIYKALDELSIEEIEDRLFGIGIKASGGGLPVWLGGDLETKPSKKTKKYFADLEEQFKQEEKQE